MFHKYDLLLPLYTKVEYNHCAIQAVVDYARQPQKNGSQNANLVKRIICVSAFCKPVRKHKNIL